MAPSVAVPTLSHGPSPQTAHKPASLSPTVESDPIGSVETIGLGTPITNRHRGNGKPFHKFLAEEEVDCISARPTTVVPAN